MTTIADFAIEAFKNLPGLINAGVNVASHITQAVQMIGTMRAENRGPTNAEYDALRASNAQLHNEFQSLGSSGSGTG